MQIEIGQNQCVAIKSKANFSVLFVTKSHQYQKLDLFTLKGATKI